jgi:hypothetical protein
MPAVRSALIDLTAPTLDPNPVVVTLEPASPPPKPTRVKRRQRQQPPPTAPMAPLIPWPGSETETGQTMLSRRPANAPSAWSPAILIIREPTRTRCSRLRLQPVFPESGPAPAAGRHGRDGPFETKLHAFWSAFVGLLRKLRGRTRLMCWHQGGRGQGGMNQRTSATEDDVMSVSSHLTVSRRSGSRRRGGFDPLR